MGDITVLHTRMRLAKSPDKRDAIRQQIFEKQQLLSYHTPDATRAAPTTGVIEPSTERDSALIAQIQDLSHRMVSLPTGPARRAMLAEIKLKQSMLSPELREEVANRPKPSYKRKRT